MNILNKMKNTKLYSRISDKKFQILIKERLAKNIQNESFIKKDKNGLKKNYNLKLQNKKNNNSRKRNNITINNSINNVINNITINTNHASQKTQNFLTINNSTSKDKGELDRLSKNKKNKKMSFLSLIKYKNKSRNKPLRHNTNSSNSSLNFFTFNNRILKYTSFVDSKNKKFPINLKNMNIWPNKKLKLITNKSLLNNSMNISINANDKKSVNPLNTSINNFDNFLRNKFFFIGKNRLIKKEMQKKIQKALEDKPWNKKNSLSIINLTNRYNNNNKKSVSKEREKNQPKNAYNIPSRNNIKNAININDKSVTLKNPTKYNIQDLSQNMTQINFILNNKHNISGNFKINNYINKSKPSFSIKDKKNFNNFNLKKFDSILDNMNINKTRVGIEEKEMNEPIIEDDIQEKPNNTNSSLDHTIKFSINSSKIEDEGELGLDEVRDIIVYYRLDEEEGKNYLFEKNDSINYSKNRKDIYLKYFFD
jgi:hypothetical protein